MDQSTFESLLADAQQQGRSALNLPDLTVTAGRMEAPVVVLIHGIGGNARHWSDPLGLDLGDTWLFDVAANPVAGASGLVSSPPYPPSSVTPWTQVLAGQQMTAVTWSQGRPADLLDYAVQEAAGVLTTLEQRVFAPYDQDVALSGGQVPPLILLCHSRGGLVARAALKQLGATGVPHLRTIVTLCTPHRGSYMPRLADTYNRTLSTSIDFSGLGRSLPGPLGMLFASRIDQLLDQLANQVRLAMLHSFGTLAQGPGFDELDPSSTTLQALPSGEAPLPGVRHYGFGGSNPTFIRYYLAEAGHVVPLPAAVASPFLVAELARLPGVSAQFGGLEELDQGDSAVALTSSTWPDAFAAPHQVFPLNHMQALVDPALQQAVLGILRS